MISFTIGLPYSHPYPLVAYNLRIKALVARQQSGFHPEGIILGGKLQEMGVALYTFLYNCPKFWGEASPPPPG